MVSPRLDLRVLEVRAVMRISVRPLFNILIVEFNAFAAFCELRVDPKTVRLSVRLSVCVSVCLCVSLCLYRRLFIWLRRLCPVLQVSNCCLAKPPISAPKYLLYLLHIFRAAEVQRLITRQ